MVSMNQWGIAGHDWAVAHLQATLLNGRIGHAYLFTGPPQVGKSTLALAFAQALNCTSEFLNQRPCGVCRACQLTRAGKHPDVRFVTPEHNARGQAVIKIEQIRALQRALGLGNYEGRYKIAIIKQFDTANLSAANAFLKTLEEPPPHVVLLLTASESEALLPTIQSRCHTMNLRPLAPAPIANVLERHWQVERPRAQLLAHLANGRLGWAVQAAQDGNQLQNHQAHIELLYEAIDGQRVARFTLADKLSRQTEAIAPLLQTWLSWWRDLMLITHQSPPNAPLINIDQRPVLERWATQWSAEASVQGVQATSQALWQLERNVNTRLLLENLLLAYPLDKT